MKKRKSCIAVLLIFFIAGCSTLAEQSRKGEYDRVMFDYDTAIRLSDFNSVCQFIDSQIMKREECMARFENLKIVGYKLLATDVSEDKREVTQTVEVKYHFLDSVVVKSIQYKQSWGYQEDGKTWRLQTKPPIFR